VEEHPSRLDVTGIDAWADACGQAYVPLQVDTSVKDFRGALREHTIGDLGVTQVASTQVTVTRTARSVRTDPRETFMFCIVLNGGGTTVQEGRVAHFRGSGGFLIDGDQPYSMRYAPKNEVLVLRVPHSVLKMAGRDLRRLTSTPIAGDSDGLNTLMGYVAGLVAMGQPVAGDSVEEHQQVAVELTRSALHPLAYPHRSQAMLSGPAILASARWLIESAHADPDLTVDDIARRFMVSRRYLEMLFARLDWGGPSEHLRRSRLRHAARLLVESPRRRIAEIAFTSGFSDVNTFTRSFKREYGATPRSWREHQLAKPQQVRLPDWSTDLLTDLGSFDWTAPGFEG